LGLTDAALEEDLVGLPAEAAKQRDKAQDRCGGHLPESICGASVDRPVLAEQNNEWMVGRRFLTPAPTTYTEALPEVQLKRPPTDNRTNRLTISHTT